MGENARLSRVAEVAETFGLEVTGPASESPIGLWSYHLPKQADPLALAAAVHEAPDVYFAELKRTIHGLPDGWFGSPDDPLFDEQYHLENSETYGGVNVDINVVPAWDSVLGHDTRMAVFDLGIHWSHEDLGNLVEAGWDGRPDHPDSIGYDLITCSDCSTDPIVGDGFHGTAVAGIILAQHNSIGVRGVAPATTIFPVRIHRDEDTALPDTFATAIKVAWSDEGVDVINMSYSLTGYSSTIAAQIDSAVSEGRGGLGTVWVNSVGNDGNSEVNFPAILGSTIAVGAIDRWGDHASDYSNTSSTGKVTMVAPSSEFPNKCGADFVTTDPEGTSGCNGAPNSDNNYTGLFGGTSAVAPQVAAAAALLLSSESTLTADEVH